MQMSNIWSVRGVSPEVRRDVLQAATAEGTTVGEWLNRHLAPLLEGDDVANGEKIDADEVAAAIDLCLADVARLQSMLRDSHD